MTENDSGGLKNLLFMPNVYFYFIRGRLQLIEDSANH
jgi:hypothetical protein